MACSLRFALLLLVPLALASARADEAARMDHPGLQAEHACLDQRERRAEIDTGKIVRLSVAIRAAKGRMAGAVVRARLCRGKDGLVYVLTVLARDGKVARITVDAVKGTLVGGL
jgi:uncharacterized membrane protein YkoI